MTVFLVTAPVLLAAVLLLAAAAKWRVPDALADASQLLRLPQWTWRPSRQLPKIEIVLGVAVLAIPWLPAAVAAAALVLVLMLAYTAVVARGLTFTPRPSCGCFGRIGSPITPDTLARNIVFTMLASMNLWWTLQGNTVPTTLFTAEVPVWGWLVMMVATAAVARWIVLERAPRFAPAQSASIVSAQVERIEPAEDATDAEDADYVRKPIPAMMLLDEDDRPVTLTKLASVKAQLLVFITCGCGRSYETVNHAIAWRDALPQIDVRLVSTRGSDLTDIFPTEAAPWLYDPDGQVFQSFGFLADPAAVLLGADGLLAGGPVWTFPEVLAFGRDIAEQLGEVLPPEADFSSAEK